MVESDKRGYLARVDYNYMYIEQALSVISLRTTMQGLHCLGCGFHPNTGWPPAN